MMLVTSQIRAQLIANCQARYNAQQHNRREPDPVPVVRFFNPIGSASWLATEIDEDNILFGLADLGFGSPELGSFSLDELQSVKLPLGLRIERDIMFEGRFPLSVYAAAARSAGSLVLAQDLLGRAARSLRERR
jgi:Protein of unknown function (DUF2958)